VGGGLSEATGGNFKDGFIGAAAANFLSPATNYINKGLHFGEAGSGAGWQYLGRTATAAVVGGTVTAISGGKFANGAVTAAFLHIVNQEVATRMSKWSNKPSTNGRIAVLYPGQDPGMGKGTTTGIGFASNARWLAGGVGTVIDTDVAGWETDLRSGYYDEVYVLGHGVVGTQFFGGEWAKNNTFTRYDLTEGSSDWKTISNSVADGGMIHLMGCDTGRGASGIAYLDSLAISVRMKNIGVTAFTGHNYIGYRQIAGIQKGSLYIGGGVVGHYTSANPNPYK
jgi:hypothetical protein